MKTPRYYAAAALALLLGATTIGCNPKVAKQPPGWQAAFAESARQIPFGPERLPEPDERAPRTDYPPGGLRITFANAPAGDTVGLSARITSEVAYPKLGLAPGLNYVWTDTAGGRARQLVIPADTSYPARWLAITQHAHTAAEPRLVFRTAGSPVALFLSYCSHCGVSGPPWCSGDSTSVEQDDEIPVDAFARYFAEHKVSR